MRIASASFDFFAILRLFSNVQNVITQYIVTIYKRAAATFVIVTNVFPTLALVLRKTSAPREVAMSMLTVRATIIVAAAQETMASATAMKRLRDGNDFSKLQARSASPHNMSPQRPTDSA